VAESHLRRKFFISDGGGDLSFLSARVIGATVAGVAKRPVMKKWRVWFLSLRDSCVSWSMDDYGTAFRLIPVFAISPGVHGAECWARAYLRNRAELGLEASESEPLMKCPCADGSFTDRKLRSSDASVWMRELLGNDCNEEELANLATHSCKATCLAWLTKTAASNNMCRRAGYHVGQEGRSELEYAHDAAAPLVRRLADTLELIREGIFCPDEPRLQRWHGTSDFESAVLLLRRGEEAKRPRKNVVDRLDLRGWSTFANFAHAPTATPGTAGAEAAIKIVLDAILGDSLAAHEAALRRLHWEAWTLTAADLKRKVDGTDEAGPRKLPVAEIGARLQVLAPKISPLKLQGILEPSHASINLFAAMLDEGRLRYVEWARLTTRDQEVLGATEDQLLKAWRPDKAGIVREHKDTPRLEANVATDLLVHHALRRRGVCFSVAELMSFEVHESLIQFLFDAYYKEPTEGYQR
ncbi:unnamed protein product, partial [Symbiodinium necroappetens]